MSKGTARRTIRITEDLWSKASEMAEEREDSVSNIIRRSLDAYIQAPITGDIMTTAIDLTNELADRVRSLSDAELAALFVETHLETRGPNAYIRVMAEDALDQRNKKVAKAAQKIHEMTPEGADYKPALAAKLRKMFGLKQGA